MNPLEFLKGVFSDKIDFDRLAFDVQNNCGCSIDRASHVALALFIIQQLLERIEVLENKMEVKS